MLIAQALRENYPRNVLFVQSLHDDNDRAILWVVETRRNCLQKPFLRRVALGFRGRAVDRMRIVNQNEVAAGARDPRRRQSFPKPALRILKLRLRVLIAR